MRTRVTIGDFSRASHLSVKTLHHYHEVGLLEPTEVDPDNGYRYYSEAQIPIAQRHHRNGRRRRVGHGDRLADLPHARLTRRRNGNPPPIAASARPPLHPLVRVV